jgi:hypothetical protein
MQRRSAVRRLAYLQRTGGVTIARMHPRMLRHTFVTTMLDAGVDLRDAQIAARHADPRTTMRYDRARKNLERHPNYILAAYMSSATLMATSAGQRGAKIKPRVMPITRGSVVLQSRGQFGPGWSGTADHPLRNSPLNPRRGFTRSSFLHRSASELTGPVR